MKSAETIIAKIEADHWLLLKREFGDDWSFEVWGIHPLRGRVGVVSKDTAKEHALRAAQKHLENCGLPGVPFQASELLWRVSVLQQVA
jgi:hypothetical protein